MNYISIYGTIEKLYQEYKSFRDSIDWIACLEWAADCIDLIGAPIEYVDKVTGSQTTNEFTWPNLDVVNYSAELPCDFISINPGGVRNANTFEVYTEASGTFHISPRPDSAIDITAGMHRRYKIQKNRIHISEETAVLQLSYKAYPIDENGFPLIPDDINVKFAVLHYIAERIAFGLWMEDRMTGEKYRKVEQERDWYMTSATTGIITPKPEEMESIKNQWTRLIPKLQEHSASFAFLGVMEQRKIQR